MENTALQEEWNTGTGKYIPAPYVESTARPPCRVLVVDDDHVTREILSALLKREQFDVELAADGAEALRVMGTTHCDIVVTDWQMPDMDGLTLCRHVRREYQAGEIYVLLFTVRNTEEDRLTGIAAGADDFVIKGGPIKEMLQRLKEARFLSLATRSSVLVEPEDPLSLTDPLTNTHNLRYFTWQIPREVERAGDARRALSVLCCHIDGFHQTNERLGHDVGAAALKAFVNAATSCIRSNGGWLARVAEDKLMIVLPETRLRAAERVANRLREVFSAVRVPTICGPTGFTVSISVTAIEPKRGMDALDLPLSELSSTDFNLLH